MFDSARDRINRARLFAQRHHTLVACTATGIITWKVTRSSTFKEVSDYVYAIEMQNEHLLLQNRVSTSSTRGIWVRSSRTTSSA